METSKGGYGLTDPPTSALPFPIWKHVEVLAQIGGIVWSLLLGFYWIHAGYKGTFAGTTPLQLDPKHMHSNSTGGQSSPTNPSAEGPAWKLDSRPHHSKPSNPGIKSKKLDTTERNLQAPNSGSFDSYVQWVSSHFEKWVDAIYHTQIGEECLKGTDKDGKLPKTIQIFGQFLANEGLAKRGDEEDVILSQRNDPIRKRRTLGSTKPTLKIPGIYTSTRNIEALLLKYQSSVNGTDATLIDNEDNMFRPKTGNVVQERQSNQDQQRVDLEDAKAILNGNRQQRDRPAVLGLVDLTWYTRPMEKAAVQALHKLENKTNLPAHIVSNTLIAHLCQDIKAGIVLQFGHHRRKEGHDLESTN
ncbi:MAG: hypothetical protein Q9168_003596 [Polycauliona sp. 1 TL-2023]